MDLRLIEQACGCTMVQCEVEAESRCVRARLLPLALGWRVLGTTTRHLQF